MAYRENSKWNQKNELQCLLIFKKLQLANFPRGKQTEYCRSIERETGLSVGNLSAKICNYKSIANVNAHSNSSKNSIEIYNEFGHLSIEQLESVLNEYKRGVK